MKQVVSISLGSSSRNKKAHLKLGDEIISIERIGCDGDEKKARACTRAFPLGSRRSEQALSSAALRRTCRHAR